MRIPEKVRIGYIDCDIEKTNSQLIDSNQEIYGKIDYSNGKIQLSSVFCKDQMNACLIHECIHGMDSCYDIKLKEEQVEKLGIAFYSFIRDNPDLFKE